MSDISEIEQLILRERQGRDRGWWEQMASCFHPDSLVNLSWFRGTGADFTTRSRAMSEAGNHPLHRLSPPVIQLNGDRAFAEVPAAIEVRFPFREAEVDLVSYSRLIYRIERREAGWKVLSLDSIYERDTLAPVVAGTSIDIRPEDLAGFRKSYRFLAFHISLRGATPRDDLFGDDQPGPAAALYDATFAWLRQ